MPEHVFLARGGQVVGLLVDAAAGEEEADGDGAQAGIARASIVRRPVVLG